ncbi:bifunctional 2-polyprenyl-6-hydroxyphenol methylase/3-demethylubiquinol 3-O-methyltransferase UbiG [Amycolatopsis sp. FDAARGOS 1241]|uniref:class I SAM-dependent methyltransferase n=1 Tax=Amycolatopsis sp. FDAARGOS 1241 TaxID=2778070 RepID=UPI0019518934|nr:class I SAM-dependent methyltransferase [Amycolatopsis sp. FDAARGOS 1241]QRP49948.1 class I SAM-dependent methyltransferase [Amycolatopsis sp. FDAARGOS 1241]
MTTSSDADYVSATRTAYNTVAVSYHELLMDSLAESPWERAMLDTFTELVGAGARVGDLGCGTGRVTGYLAAHGLDAFGIDLSPGMIEVARQSYPGLEFEVGSLAALPLADASLPGALAWYSLIHTPPERLPVLVAELARVLEPGGRLLTGFQLGTERRHITNAYGHDNLSLDAYRLDPDFVAGLLTDAGFTIDARLISKEEPPYQTPQAYLLATKEN